MDDEPDQRQAGAGNTVFDGESKVKDVFADVIIQKFLRDREKKHLHKREAILYNEHSVPQNQGLSGLRGETYRSPGIVSG